jgi:signal transduction histidine kinase
MKTNGKPSKGQLKAEGRRDMRTPSPLLTLSHELRTPVGTILNAAEVLLAAGRMDNSDLELVRLMRRQAQGMAHLIEEVVSLESLDQKSQPAAPLKPLKISKPLKDAIDTCHSLIENQGHKLVTDSIEDEAWVAGDRYQLSQVFTNILANAAKYMPTGGVIQVSAKTIGMEALVSIEDQGSGINAEDLPHIFDEFWRARQIETNGIGLGLAIAKSIVEKHRGRIFASSAGPGQGSRFCVALPVSEESQALGAEHQDATHLLEEQHA